MAATDLLCAADRAQFIRQVLGAGEWDAAIECDWSVATVIEEFRVEPGVARQAIKLYPNALRARAELRAVEGDDDDAE